jgi:starch phosphorylase
MDNIKRYLTRELPSPLDRLTELALDLRWSWSHSSDALWRTIDPELWEATSNPWLIMESTSRERLEELAQNDQFRAELERQLTEREENLNETTWFDSLSDGDTLNLVAYFSMEFGLSESLPIYSGGLGILAGDVLKTASDLGVPVIGVGLLYQQGYFRQALNVKGEQLAYFPYNDPAMLPVMPLRDGDGGWLRVTVELPGRSLQLRCWEARVGRTRLLLLDANDLVNNPRDRGITGELYGGDDETRLEQEVVLGIGGWRMLKALGLQPKVCHLNEGHAALAVLERGAHCMRDHTITFDEALLCTRAGNVFTTHTPVPAAFDRFAPSLARQYLSPYAEQWGMDIETLLDLGRAHPGNTEESFNLAYLALRASDAANGVSRLHGAVSRELFAPLFPRWPLAEVPIGHITNGVHMPSWDSREADELWTQACGKMRWTGELDTIENDIHALADETLWDFRARQRQEFMLAVRNRLARQRASRGAARDTIDECAHLLDPNALTLGFARRFTAYKRPNLLLAQPDRLQRLLSDPQRPVQLVIAGKAHPKDGDGQAMIREWAEFIRRPGLPHGRVVFIEDYDMAVASELVQGVDVWVNTPRRPWEASGTSGMKVLVNGGLNVSELDGWWAEAYAPEVGWALGDRGEHDSDPAWDAFEAETLYKLLEKAVIPEFYTRDSDGIPRRWVARVRESMARLTPSYSTNRMLREYVELYYLPRAHALDARLANGAPAVHDIHQWRQRIRAHWQALRIGNIDMTPTDDGLEVDVQVFLDDLPPDDVGVQLYADGDTPSAPPERHPLQRGPALSGAVNGFRYQARIPTSRPASDYTVRAIPFHPLAEVPLEEDCIHWAV